MFNIAACIENLLASLSGCRVYFAYLAGMGCNYLTHNLQNSHDAKNVVVVNIKIWFVYTLFNERVKVLLYLIFVIMKSELHTLGHCEGLYYAAAEDDPFLHRPYGVLA